MSSHAESAGKQWEWNSMKNLCEFETQFLVMMFLLHRYDSNISGL